MNSSKTAIATDPSEPLIVDALYEALTGVLEMLDTGTPPYIDKLLERYEKEYGEKSS